jgi:hypothetical protein
MHPVRAKAVISKEIGEGSIASNVYVARGCRDRYALRAGLVFPQTTPSPQGTRQKSA